MDGDTDCPLKLEDFENLYLYPEYHGEFADFNSGFQEDLEDEIQRLEGIIDDKGDKEGYEGYISDEIHDLERLEEEKKEIYEYWLISSPLANDLERKGEPVAKAGGMNIWGRTKTGQMVGSDEVIKEIYNESQNR